MKIFISLSNQFKKFKFLNFNSLRKWKISILLMPFTEYISNIKYRMINKKAVPKLCVIKVDVVN